jgi:hypothetical protein
MRVKPTVKISKEVYNELIEVERKYLLLVAYLQKLSSSLGDVKTILDDFLKTK